MWPISETTIEELENKAYLVYTEFGTKAQIPREQRLWEKFPDVDRTTIKIWLDQFNSIDREIARLTRDGEDFDSKALKKRLSEKFPFLDRRGLDRAAFIGWFSTR